ncbi:uncharacterized protein LOC103524341 isoform X2 [Diaphorina citri]|uniref:Uncharacterized protein LOC103524341 isoform X1 n=1 Tax=Diaphorina citri TaxID=121845 RepID=A0A3Q0JPR8_DIACI|nr:uncharacterized protein LOC103524341 isoform X1 [Diaphorina citri]XP_026689252.1 uncharacterized protein LOC103524341 isoform X1 [Diaphorina citri]XP_026689253.1 uncharacterized protein LOC103524341 isoform X2 [Diaphorina citri]KAI5693780.1 hypothetical protein M8J75_005573 [Diaphorina citri]KAI5714206.1 hypothetical protein M8J76_012889 [Diaphorina citri]
MQGSPMCGTKMQITNSKPVSSPRSRRKPKWKLKFHHQALPQEYLNHYETWQHSQPPSPAPLASITQTLCPPIVPDLELASPPPPLTKSRASPLSTSPPVLKSPLSISPLKSPISTSPPVLKSPRPFLSPTSVRLTDLPYMGEMVLDNARPRRGRKPKKLDICHLIYKNYGTTVVDEPLNLCIRDFAIPTTNRLEQTSSLLPTNTMGSTIIHHNSHTPSDNHVSMCKFKFTSGSKPSLLEKKLLTSQHPGAIRQPNRRQKSIDLLTQQQLLGNLLVNETNTKLVTGELSPMDNLKVSDPVMASLLRTNSSDIEMRDEDEDMDSDETASNEVPDSFANASPFGYNYPNLPLPENSPEIDCESLLPDVKYCDNAFPSSSTPSATLNRRKSRKSQAREKLEKTFKEKGFLIQTQQLESAEGATYCKFRQLRKFTRYLFRSWKTHLPGEVVNETYNMQ